MNPGAGASGPRINLGYVTLLAATASLGGFLSVSSAVINGAVSGIQASFHSSGFATGFQVASILLGCAVGALIAGRLADWLGRRMTMILTAILFAVTAAAAGLAGTDTLFSISRFLSGIAVGGERRFAGLHRGDLALWHPRPARLTPTARDRRRHLRLAALRSPHREGGWRHQRAVLARHLEAWRWMFLAEIIPSGSLRLRVARRAGVPAPPRGHGRERKPSRVLRRIQSTWEEEKIAEIRTTVAGDHRPRFHDLRGPAGAILPVVWVGVGLSVLQQLVGINSIFYYGSVLWEAVGSRGGFLCASMSSPAPSTSSPRSSRWPWSIGWGASRYCWGARSAWSVTLAVVVFVFATGASGPSRAAGSPARRGVRRRSSRRTPTCSPSAVLGSLRLGAARRDVLQPHPRLCSRRGGVRAVGGELARDGQLPVVAGRFGRDGRLLRVPVLHARLVPLRCAEGPGDAGPPPRRDVGRWARARGGAGDSPRRVERQDQIELRAVDPVRVVDENIRQVVLLDGEFRVAVSTAEAAAGRNTSRCGRIH